jgi:preprotein translocase subunit SecG
MEVVVLVIHLFIALGLIGVILLQRSEGGALGIGGGGTGGGLFSARGAANVLTRTTAYLATAFFITSIALSLLAKHGATKGSILDGAATSQPAAPALPELPQGKPADPAAVPDPTAPSAPAAASPAPSAPKPPADEAPKAGAKPAENAKPAEGNKPQP